MFITSLDSAISLPAYCRRLRFTSRYCRKFRVSSGPRPHYHPLQLCKRLMFTPSITKVTGDDWTTAAIAAKGHERLGYSRWIALSGGMLSLTHWKWRLRGPLIVLAPPSQQRQKCAVVLDPQSQGSAFHVRS